jgi:hypothetical protein
MRHARPHWVCAVVRDHLTKDRGIQQGFSPDRKGELWPPLKRLQQLW